MTGLNFNPAAIKTHLYCSWKTLINQPVILVGTSMGGAAAIDFAQSYPQAVEKLISINSMGDLNALALGQLLFSPLDFWAVEYWRQRKLQALNLAILSGWDARHIEASKCVNLHMDMPSWSEAMIAFTKSGGYGRLGEKICRVHQKTLILWGELDGIGTEDAYKFRRDIGDSKLVWVKNCGHSPQFEQPEFTAEQILTFAR
jgi:pimeloyl-ACP methyl ester carboxylesterase